jgi:hypothetical protein
MPRPAKPAEAQGKSSLGLTVFTGGFVLVLAVHPDRFSGWALWALSPLLLSFAYLLVFRAPPQRGRLYAAAAVAGGYSVVYGIAAGFGDEGYTDVARIVYLFLPALGVLLTFAYVAVVELICGLAATRSTDGPASFDALPFGRAVLVATALVSAWTTFAVTGWTNPKVVVAADAGKDPAGTAQVRCEGEDTYLLTTTVLTQEDGVHVRVDNRSGRELWLEYEIDGGSHGGGAELVGPGVSERRIFIGGSSIGLACSRRGDGSASDYATMAVVNAGAAAPTIPSGG